MQGQRHGRTFGKVLDADADGQRHGSGKRRLRPALLSRQREGHAHRHALRDVVQGHRQHQQRDDQDQHGHAAEGAQIAQDAFIRDRYDGIPAVVHLVVIDTAAVAVQVGDVFVEFIQLPGGNLFQQGVAVSLQISIR